MKINKIAIVLLGLVSLVLAIMLYQQNIKSEEVRQELSRFSEINKELQDKIDEYEQETRDLNDQFLLAEKEHKESIEKHSNLLKKQREDLAEKKVFTKEEFFKMVMERFSYQIRLGADTYNSNVEVLEDIYKISTDYNIENQWFLLNDDSFEIELLGYEDAKEVSFYYDKLETCLVDALLVTDSDSSDGWTFKHDAISDVFGTYTLDYDMWPPTYILYAKITMKDGQVITSQVLPLYNVN